MRPEWVAVMLEPQQVQPSALLFSPVQALSLVESSVESVVE